MTVLITARLEIPVLTNGTTIGCKKICRNSHVSVHRKKRVIYMTVSTTARLEITALPHGTSYRL